MIVHSGAKTRAEQVYRQLRYAVMSGQLEPGQRVKLADLCQEYSVSLSVVREAATRLGEQGLIRGEPNRGFRVAELSVADLDDLTFVRVEVESLCLRQSVAFGDMAWEAGVVAAHHTLRRASAAVAAHQDPETDLILSEAHSDFHRALAAGCKSPRLLAFRQTLFDSSELYRHWSVTASAAERDPDGEHAAIVEAALDRDADGAVENLVNHITRTAEWLASGTPTAVTLARTFPV